MYNDNNNVLQYQYLLLFVTLLSILLLFHCAEICVKNILKRMGYTDINNNSYNEDPKTSNKSHKTRQWNIIAALVTLFIAIASIIITFNTDIDNCFDTDAPDTLFAKYSRHTMMVMLSYFVYDIMFHKLDTPFYLHHILGLTSILYALYIKHSILYYTVRVVVIELSTPPLFMIHLSSGILK